MAVCDFDANTVSNANTIHLMRIRYSVAVCDFDAKCRDIYALPFCRA